MTIDKPIENWTKFPNCILDNLEKYTPQEFKVLGHMVRKNIGFNRPNKQFSVSYLSVKTGMSKPTVMKAVDGLLQKESIAIVNSGSRGQRYFDIMWQDPLVKEIDRSKILTSTGKNSLPDPVKEIDRLLDNTKRKHVNNKEVVIPEQLTNVIGFKEAWLEWLAYRKQKRLTSTSMTLSKQLLLLSKTPTAAIAMMDRSITNGWQGLFEIPATKEAKPAYQKYMRG